MPVSTRVRASHRLLHWESDGGYGPVRTFAARRGVSGTYTGVIGVAATDDGGYAVVGLQACKLNSQPVFTLDGNENKFNLSETEGYAVPVNSKLTRIKFYETASTFTAPTSGANFLAHFTG